jgi:hypothetical protein
MTQEDKELLLKDLCARLPYSTLCYCKWTKDAPNGTSGCVQEVSTYLLEELMIIGDQNYECQICEITPYLRPLSSMTKDEKKELGNYLSTEIFLSIDGLYSVLMAQRHTSNFLYSRHLDVLGLIEKGLAVEAPEDMYNI